MNIKKAGKNISQQEEKVSRDPQPDRNPNKNMEGEYYLVIMGRQRLKWVKMSVKFWYYRKLKGEREVGFTSRTTKLLSSGEIVGGTRLGCVG